MRKGLFVLLVCVIAVSGGMAMFRIGMTAIVDHPALEPDFDSWHSKKRVKRGTRF